MYVVSRAKEKKEVGGKVVGRVYQKCRYLLA